MIFNLNYMVRHGTVTALDEERNLFEWRLDESVDFFTEQLKFMRRMTRTFNDDLIGELACDNAVSRKEICREICNYFAMSQRREDVSMWRVGSKVEIDSMFVACSKYIR
jgi:hypothetical protein